MVANDRSGALEERDKRACQNGYLFLCRWIFDWTNFL